MSSIRIFFILICATSVVVRAETYSKYMKDYVIAHNRYRELAMPSAEAMRFVVWNATIENLAVEAAKMCIYKHTNKKNTKFSGHGENIAFQDYEFSGAYLNDIRRYFMERNGYDPGLTNCRRGCNHYFQVMTENVKTIGCATEDCNPLRKTPFGDIPANVTFCLYNAENQYYTRGPACSACPPDMPLCLHNLCVNKELARHEVMKEYDPTVTSSTDFKCRLICRNCGKLVTDRSGVCRCNCTGTDATGHLCQDKSKSSAVKCSPCSQETMSHPCLNGGTGDSSITDEKLCKCKCPAGYLGHRCEIPADQFGNSVKLVVHSVFGTDVVPVSISQFNWQIWPVLRGALADAVNSFCRANFAKCCPGQTYPDNAATPEYAKADNFKFIETALGHTFKGEVYSLVFANVSDLHLCSGVNGYIPQAALLTAVKSAQKKISAQLNYCCGKQIVTLKDPGAAVPVLRDLEVGVHFPKAASKSTPSKFLGLIMLVLLAMIMS